MTDEHEATRKAAIRLGLAQSLAHTKPIGWVRGWIKMTLYPPALILCDRCWQPHVEADVHPFTDDTMMCVKCRDEEDHTVRT